jgi:hypothetical protein
MAAQTTTPPSTRIVPVSAGTGGSVREQPRRTYDPLGGDHTTGQLQQSEQPGGRHAGDSHECLDEPKTMRPQSGRNT